MSEEVVEEFKAKIEDFTSRNLDSRTPLEDANSNKGKFIHDTVWGTNFFYPWEIALIDSPLLQRLRYIHQTGLAYYVYPTAIHTRFDHTLGVTSLINKVIDSLNSKNDEPIIKNKDRYMLRISALLHDIGHGPFSHVVESVIRKTDEYRAMEKHVNVELGVSPKPHEIMSYLIVSSNSFRDWFDQKIRNGYPKNKYLKELELGEIAESIIGVSRNPERKYISDMINGPLDVDKLDYFARDALFSGLSIKYDLDRYFKSVELQENPVENRGTYVRLGLRLFDVTVLEQIILCKMMLFSSLYHHQKLRCAENMFIQLCEKLMQGEASKKSGLKIKHPADFLDYVDSDIINFTSRNQNPFKGEAKALCLNISRRRLMKRALIISRPYIQGIEDSPAIKSAYQRLVTDIKEHNTNLKIKILKETKNIIDDKKQDIEISVGDIIVDMPDPPLMKEAMSISFPSESRGVVNRKPIELNDAFPIKEWAEGYNAIKLRGHVFCYDELRPYIKQASRKVFVKPPYNLIFSKDATSLCKLECEILEEEKQHKLPV